jgi:NADH-quinone oxidoreductase subunit C/D
MSSNNRDIISELRSEFGEQIVLYQQQTKDSIPSIWIERNNLVKVVKYLKSGVALPFKMLFDLTAIDERTRTKRNGQPVSDFSVVYHLT